jgi:hypothetical protein
VCGREAVEVLSPKGNFSAMYPIQAEAECVSFGDNGRLYLGTGNYVSVLDTETGLINEWTVLDERSIITSVAVSGENVFVADAGTATVWVFDSLGMLQSVIEDFFVPSPYFDVAAAAGGLAWIVDPGRHTIALYNAAGERSAAFGRYSPAVDGFGGCCNPANIALRADGTIITAEKGIMRVKLFDQNGDFRGLAAAPEDFPFYDSEIDVVSGSSNEILVLSPLARKICVFEEIEI